MASVERYQQATSRGAKKAAAQAVHKHERNMHKGKKPTRLPTGKRSK